MSRVLRPQQVQIADFVARHERGNVWARMGTGKTGATLVGLAAADAIEPVFPALVVGPKRVAEHVWPSEVKEWGKVLSGLRVRSGTGGPKERAEALDAPHDVLTVNYENLPWLVTVLGNSWPYRTVVADESSRLRGFRLTQGSARAAAIAKVAHKRVRRWVNLTGTPAPNGLVNLWGQQWFVDRGERLGRTFSAFEKRWFYSRQVGSSAFARQLVPFERSQAEIQAALADCTLTVQMDGLQAPVVETIRVELPPTARRHYRQLERELFTRLDAGDVEAPHTAALSVKCLQAANGALYVDGGDRWAALHDEKLDALESLVEELNGAPLLVAYHFRSDLERLRERFKQLKTLDDGKHVIDDWNMGRVPMLAIHPASAGHGLNLQHGGNVIAFFGLWWNLEEHEQVIERIGPARQMQSGYNRPTYVYYIVAEDTVDLLVLERLASKASVQEVLLAAMRRRK